LNLIIIESDFWSKVLEESIKEMEQQQQWHSSKNIVWLINPGNPTVKEFMDMSDTSDNQNNSKNLEDGAVGGASGGGCADGGSTSTTSSDESRLAIQRCLQSLAHASQCRDINCRITSCRKMKRVLQHIKRCKCRSNKGAQPTSNCPICKQLISLCCYHAKQCTESKCPVPYCVNIKFKLRQQQLLKRLQEIQILNRCSPLMTGISQQSSQHDCRPSPQELVTHPQQQSQTTQMNNLYVKCKPVHNSQQQQIQQQILERRIALMASLSKHSSQPQKSPQQHYMKPTTATPLPTNASGLQEVVTRDQQQPQLNQMNNPYVKSEPVHHLQQQEPQQSPRPTINCNQQQMYSNVTPQRYWTQNVSEEKPQSVPLTRSAPQQRLTYPVFQTQRPPIPSDILLSQQQSDFGAQQHQQQEFTPEDQLTIIIENL
jgi:hypothetical protein